VNISNADKIKNSKIITFEKEGKMSLFLEVIEWMNPGENEMIHRIPEQGSADIKLGAQCIVRDSQSAVFFSNGKACDVLGTGRHTLTTLNLPILTKILSLPWGFKSPFRAEVYFVNHKVFTNLRWGTKDPVVFRDSELGVIRLRAFGAYTFKIVEPLLFLNTMVGRENIFTTEQIEDYLRQVILSRVNDLFGEKLDTIFELPKRYQQLAQEARIKLTNEFDRYGMELLDFYISSITPPDEVQKMIDEKSGMKAVGDLDKFLKFEMAKALGQSGSGSLTQAGVGMGAGVGVGVLVPSLLSKALSPDQKDLKDEPLPTVTCPKCGADTPEHSRFCYKCGHQLIVINRCPKCGKDLPAEANFCMVCGLNLAEKTKCKKCNAILPPGTKFCLNCGEKID
jgi:membrane protease subunit (stomatin/prohibitin family)